MWCPTHVQVTVQKARGLVTKGKNDTNNAFVTIALGKEKYQTSVKEKASDTIEWHEKCELQIPKQGNTAEITLTALHRNIVGVDHFLGHVSIPLAELDFYERPKNKWLKLKDKPGKDKKKDRGELEVKVAFIVKAGSLADLSKKEKHKSSLGSLAFSGSLISISSLDKRKGLKKLASKIGKKVSGKSKKDDDNSDQGNQQANPNIGLGVSKQVPGEADPGVISEGESEDDFTDSSPEQSVEVLSINVPSIDDKSEDKIKMDDGDKEKEDEHKILETSASVADSSDAESTEKLQISDQPVPVIEKSQTFDKVQSVGANVSKHWMKAYRKIKIGHASIRMLDELSHKGSGCSLEIPPHANSATSSLTAGTTPISGSLENLAGGEVLRRNSITSLPTLTPPTKPPRIVTIQPEKKVDEWEQKLYGKHGKDSKPCSPLTFNRNTMERIIIGGETEKTPTTVTSSRISSEVLKKFEGRSREDLIELVIELESKLSEKRNQLKDLDDYLDNLLLRVMETSPRILQNPYSNCKTQVQIM